MRTLVTTRTHLQDSMNLVMRETEYLWNLKTISAGLQLILACVSGCYLSTDVGDILIMIDVGSKSRPRTQPIYEYSVAPHFY